MNLPSYLILGVQRGGTTSLWGSLNQHPSIKSAITKEVHFFDWYYWFGVDWYKTYFPEGFTGESTTQYILNPCIPKRILQTIPNVKLIVLLRNPVQRAYSHWALQSKYHQYPVENLTFEEAIEKEEEQLRGLALMVNACSFDILTIKGLACYYRYSYKLRGHYAEQLERYYQVFPKDRLFVIKSEDLFTQPAQVYKDVIEFLGLPSWTPPTFANTTTFKSKASNVPPMNVDTRKQLVDYFEPHNQRLYNLLDRDMGWK
jgi:hypothetical protein